MRRVAPIVVLLGLAAATAFAGSSARADHPVPSDVMREIAQLSGAAGVLSSRSCRDTRNAEAATDLLSRLINHLRHSKYFDRDGQRRFRRSVVIPRIQEERTVSHSSRDCAAARQKTADADSRWRATDGTPAFSGVFSLGEWGTETTELSRVPALGPPATARGRR